VRHRDRPQFGGDHAGCHPGNGGIGIVEVDHPTTKRCRLLQQIRLGWQGHSREVVGILRLGR
jgi:hypothetical protein